MNEAKTHPERVTVIFAGRTFVVCWTAIVAARRERLAELSAEWTEDQREQLAAVSQQLACEPVPPRERGRAA